MSKKMYGPSVYALSAEGHLALSLERPGLGSKVRVKNNTAAHYIHIGNEQLLILP